MSPADKIDSVQVILLLPLLLLEAAELQLLLHLLAVGESYSFLHFACLLFAR